jgi:predicted transcriptional regulator
MGKSLTEMASEIVAAQASHAVMAADEMVAALKKTFDALKNIKTIEEGGPEADAPPVDPRKSIQRNYIINLEDGKKYKQLTTRTLAKYGLTPAPLAAKALSAKRRKTAKALGLGERLQEARKAKAAAAAKAKAKASKAKTKAKPKPKKKRKAARKKKKA